MRLPQPCRLYSTPCRTRRSLRCCSRCPSMSMRGPRITGTKRINPEGLSRSIELCVHAALDGRARHQRVVPALDMEEIGKLHLVARMPPRPAEDGEISDRYRTGNQFAVRQPAI